MNYIVFDLEFNQYYNPTEDALENISSSCPFEIIQIGAIKLDKNLNLLSKFSSYVKPEIYTILSPFVKNITGITEDILNNGNTFKDVFNDFIDFLGNDKSILCVWGKADIKELFRNTQYHSLDTSLIPKGYIDIQKYASKYFNCLKGVQIGLKNAVDLLNISHEDSFHDALSDASYTVEVFKKIYNNDMVPKLFDFSIRKSLHKKATNKINFYRLFKQFEKMYNRKITAEEKSIIKLAYLMGKTNQFHN